MLKNILTQNKLNFSDVIDIRNKRLFKFDFSKENKELTPEIINSTNALAAYIDETLLKNDAEIGYGGYLEDRAIYKKSVHFGGDDINSRTIHLGVDIWCKAGEPVFAPCDAVVHSFKNNNNFGDYGATIILKHTIDNVDFYTLYGHLSLKSLENIKVNDVIKQSEKFAELGNESENGNWPPHLHFQIINDIEGKFGDYPGVCSFKEIDKYSANCINPKYILGI